jgi:hypothetical protein
VTLSIASMLMEIARLTLGLLMALFHRPVADFMLERERSLVITLRQRGLPVPAAPTQETARTMYFCIGIFMAAWELARIWLMHRGLM